MAWTSPKTWTSAVLSSAEMNTHLRDNLLHICSTTGNLTLPTTGPHGLGAAPLLWASLRIGGTFSPTADISAAGAIIDQHVVLGVDTDGYGWFIAPTFTEAGSGTHRAVVSMMIAGPQGLAAGGATVTTAATLWLNGIASDATNCVSLLIEHAGSDERAVALSDTTDIAHGITALAPTSVYGVLRKANATAGGLSIQGYSAGGVGQLWTTVTTTADTTAAGASAGAILVVAELKSGTGTTAHGATTNIVTFRNSTSATHIFKGNGDSYEDGTGWTAYDDADDAALIETLEYEVTAAQGQPIRRQFTAWMTEQRGLLERLQLASFNDDGTIFVNRSGIQELLCGFARQAAARLVALEQRLAALEAARG